MKRRINHGQAMRSIFGRARVTQRLTDSPVTPRSGRFFTRGAPDSIHCRKPPSRKVALRPGAHSFSAAVMPTCRP